MSKDEIAAIRLLSRCRVYHRREREKIKEWRLMLDCDPDMDIGGWDNRKLFEMLHKYRAQHRQCPCLPCLNAMLCPGSTKGKPASPHDRSLFAEGEII